MAEKINGISLSIGLETKEFKSGLTELKHQLSLTTDSVKLWKDQLKLDPKNITYLEKYGQAINDLEREANETRDGLKRMFDEMVASGYSPSDERLKAVVRQMNSLDNVLDRAIPNYKEFYETIVNANNGIGNSFDNVNTKTLKFKDVVLADLLSSAIKTGLSELASLMKSIGDAYIDLIKGGVEYNMQMQSFSTSLHAIADDGKGGAQAVDDLIDSLTDLGKRSSFSTSALLETAQQLTASGISAEETGKSITDLAKILAFAGKGDDELKRMAQNLNQIKNAGKATSADIKQFAYAGIPVYSLLADYSDKFATISKDTLVTYEDFVGAFSVASKEGSKYFNAIEVQSSTLAGQINLAKSNFEVLSGVIAGDMTNALANDFMPAINETINAMTTGFQEGGIQGMLTALSDGIGKLAPLVLENLPLLIQTGIDIANGLMDGLLQEDENGNTILEQCIEQLVEWLTNFVMTDEHFFQNLIRIGFEIAKGIIKGFYQGLLDAWHSMDTSELDAIVDQYNADMSAQSTVGSGGFGALPNVPQFQSGGYGNVTLNASFNVSGNLDEAKALYLADIMSDRLNENLGKLI